MRVLTAFVLASILVLPACDLVGPPGGSDPAPVQPAEPPPPPVVRRISIRSESRTWREDPAFDAAGDLVRRLRQLGIEAQTLGAIAPDGELLVEVEETKGDEYMGGGIGTAISVRATFLAPGTREVILEAQARGSTPYFVQGWSLYEAAIEELRKDRVFQAIPSFVALLTGLEVGIAGTLEAGANPDAAAVVVQVLERAGFRPRTPEEEAWVALARNDYEACVGLGGPAVTPIVRRLECWFWADETIRMADALRRIGDPRAGRPLLDRLRNAGPSPSMPEDRTMVLALLSALERVGGPFALGTLDEFARSEDAEVAAAARKAAEGVRARR